MADNLIYDGFSAFPGGMDSGTLPRLLPPTKTSFAFNTTFRGGFATDRPKFRKINLDFGGNTDVQMAVEKGLWQEGSYFSPNSGLNRIMALISGRLFEFIPDTLNNATVAEKTIVNDRDDPIATQAWMTVAEIWHITNDGSSLPIFYDGVTARRSFGSSQLLGTTSANFTVPAVGDNVQITLASAYTGPVGVVVTIGTGTYIVVSIGSGGVGPSGYPKILDFFGGHVGITIPAGSSIFARNLLDYSILNFGQIAADFVIPSGGVTVIAYFTTNITIPGAIYSTPWIQSGGVNYTCGVADYSSGTPDPSSIITIQNITGTPAATVTAGADMATVPELPPGRVIVYGLGRTWESLPDGISFTASDLVGESSGSTAYDYRDAVLKVTKNTALTQGKPFRVPGSGQTIRAMSFVAALDQSLGQGPLQVLTNRNIFSCQAPLASATWAALTSPILTQSLIGSGGVSQGAIVQSNADIIFKSHDASIRSLIMARLDYNQWGNTPISHEMERVINQEDKSLVIYSSGTVFGNRALLTYNPVQCSQGVYHRGLIVINFDEISSLQGKSSSIYDGLWTGLNVLKLIPSNVFYNVDRQFLFCYNSVDEKIELWELLDDDGVVSDDGTPTIWGIESADLFRGERGELINTFKALEGGELSVDDVQGNVTIKVFYKPDQYPGWIPWHDWSVSVDMGLPNSQPGYFPRMGLGRPSSTDDNIGTGQPTRFGYTFQVRIVIQGHCQLTGAKFSASIQPQPKISTPIDGNKIGAISVPALDDFAIYNISAGIVSL